MAERTTVLVHGNPETAAIWGPLTDALRAHGRGSVVALSPPGFGAPLPDDFDPTMENYAHWLVGELETIRATGAEIDLVGHDWGAGHVFGVLAERPDLVRTWAADCVGLTHPDYVWHDAAQAWQTPGTGEEVVQMMFGLPLAERVSMLEGLGLPPDVAADVADGLTAEMGACVLTLYRSAAQPAMAELGTRLAATQLPPGLVIIATDDHYAGDRSMMDERIATYDASAFVLEGLGHWWMFDGAAAAAEALIAHWRR